MSQREILASVDGRRLGLTSDNGLTLKNAVLQEYRADIYEFAGTSLTLSDSLSGSNIVFTSANPVTVTVPSTLSVGFNIMLIQDGAGAVTITAGASATVHNASGFTHTRGQYAVAAIVVYRAGIAILGGDCA
jgi:hypothetical protein